MKLLNSTQEVTKIVEFLQQTYSSVQKKVGIIAVSGGIDSALSLTLLTRALGAQNTIPVMLPYGEQDMSDAELILNFNKN